MFISKIIQQRHADQVASAPPQNGISCSGQQSSPIGSMLSSGLVVRAFAFAQHLFGFPPQFLP
jgi:hypothetical protein